MLATTTTCRHCGGDLLRTEEPDEGWCIGCFTTQYLLKPLPYAPQMPDKRAHYVKGEYRNGPRRETILKALERATRPLTAEEIANVTHIARRAVYDVLPVLHEAGMIEQGPDRVTQASGFVRGIQRAKTWREVA